MIGSTVPDASVPSDESDRRDPLAPKLIALRQELARAGPLLVAFSGGVDSALLAVVAREVHGDRMICALVDDPFVPRAAVEDARRIAQQYDLPLVVIHRDPFGDQELTANPPDRCYHCKKDSARLLWHEAAAHGFSAVVDGANISDLSEHRPGLTACAEERIEHPFITTGIAKSEIRAIARSLGLSFAEKPSAACLSSRIPYGVTLTPEVLAMVEEAEVSLHGLGFAQGRVRAHDRLARIEVPPAELAKALTAAPDLVSAVKAAGFVYVTLDLEGYRSGAMDEVLEDRTK